jgi:hypothetical protein
VRRACGGSVFSKAWRTATLALLGIVVPGCAPAAGPFVLDAASGRVIDEDTREPIPGATVIEWYRGAGRFGGPQPSYHARFATTDDAGRFAFPREAVWSLRMWALRTYGPTYGFHHPSYGLETGTPRRVSADDDASPGELRLEGSLRRSHLRLDALRAWCAGRRDEDAAAAHLREIACPLERHAHWPSGVPRAEGPRDARGRRTGEWTFRYADGTIAARGVYREGGAVGDWEFYDRAGSRVDSGSAEAP